MKGLTLSNIPFDLIINILNIAIMFIIVRLLVYKPVKKFMAARTQKLNDEKAQAQEKLDKANALQAKYESLISENEAQSNEILKKSREEADRQAREIVESARKKSEKMIAEANERIALKEDEAKLQMQEDVIDLSLSIASKLLDRNITDEDNKRLAKAFFDAECHGGN